MTRFPFATRRTAGGWVAGMLLAALAAGPLAASDHADPIRLDRQEGGITDLFVFPAKNRLRRVKEPAQKDQPERFRAVSAAEANRLVIVFCVRRSLTASPPYEGLDQFTYKIHADFHSASEASFRKDDPNFARYGGTVKAPEGIDPDFTITVRLDNLTKFVEKDVKIKVGDEWKQPKMADGIEWYSGVRDDPFIFPMFFGTNVIAMAISVPLDCFPGGQQDFLFWATSHRRGVQIDHVGRSQRTQLPRFDVLNTLPPKDHVTALLKQDQQPGIMTDVLRTYVRPPFNLRPYDFQPDVMFYTHRLEARFPNGRQLEDDVAAMTCQQGDCQLFELSFALKDPKPYAATGGRPTKNDKDFRDEFPFLADPWPDKAATPPPELTARTLIILISAGLVAVLFLVVLPWWLVFRSYTRLQRFRAAQPPPSPATPATPAPQPAVGGPQS